MAFFFRFSFIVLFFFFALLNSLSIIMDASSRCRRCIVLLFVLMCSGSYDDDDAFMFAICQTAKNKRAMGRLPKSKWEHSYIILFESHKMNSVPSQLFKINLMAAAHFYFFILPMIRRLRATRKYQKPYRIASGGWVSIVISFVFTNFFTI